MYGTIGFGGKRVGKWEITRNHPPTDLTEHLGPLHTRDREPMSITLQALSLVEKAEPVQVHSTLYAQGTNGVCQCKMDVKST